MLTTRGARFRSPSLRAATRDLGRGDLLVLAVAALGLGSVWARLGVSVDGPPPNPGGYIAGIALVALAAGLCVAAARMPAALPQPRVLAAAIALEVVVQPGFLMPTPVRLLLGGALGAVPLLRSARAAWALLGVCALGTAAAIAGSWVWGTVANDVFVEVQGASAALLHGQNPYSPLFPVYLGHQGSTTFFGAEPFCYGPVVVLLSLPARLLGDVRLTVAAFNVAILAAALVWTRRAGGARLVRSVAALGMASPLLPFMVLMDWTDSFSIAGLAWWLVLRDRDRGWATVCLALALGSKPTFVPLLVPLAFWSRDVRRELVWAASAAVALMAPFAIWTGVAQFAYDTVGVFADLPARADGITVDGLLGVVGMPYLAGGVLIAAAGVTAALLLRVRPRDTGAFLALGAALMVTTCLLSKQAFLNYYDVAAVALLFAAGAGSAMPRGGFASPVAELRGVVARPASAKFVTRRHGTATGMRPRSAPAADTVASPRVMTPEVPTVR